MEPNSQWFITNEFQLNTYITHVKEEFLAHKYLTGYIKKGKQRTLLQNAALHKYFSLLSEELNDSGQEMLHFFKDGVDIPWNPVLVKELIWRPIQEAMLNERSTADAKTMEYVKIYETLNRHLSEKRGIYVAWPESSHKQR
tara:strand:+ start:188 stop:610 length:423 start_codon:yes stop_codon:yes gene_type:complete